MSTKSNMKQTSSAARRSVAITIHVSPATKAAIAAKAGAAKSSMSETAAGIITREIQAEQQQQKGQPLY